MRSKDNYKNESETVSAKCLQLLTLTDRCNSQMSKLNCLDRVYRGRERERESCPHPLVFQLNLCYVIVSFELCLFSVILVFVALQELLSDKTRTWLGFAHVKK